MEGWGREETWSTDSLGFSSCAMEKNRAGYKGPRGGGCCFVQEGEGRSSPVRGL